MQAERHWGNSALFLIDRNADPQKTVYYISAKIFEVLSRQGGLSLIDLSTIVSNELRLNVRKQTFVLLALDFLFLLGKVQSDSEGIVYVN